MNLMNDSISSLKLTAYVSVLSTSLIGLSFLKPAIADTTTATPVAASQEIAQANGDIVDIASSNVNFTTLVQAVKAANLVDALKAEGPLTVFAPTNAAFAALPEGVLDALLLPENRDLLTQILTYHVVAGKVVSSDVVTGNVKTLNGAEIAAKVSPEGVDINDASVVQADVEASNGVIHAIDGVLLPPGVVTELQSRLTSDSVEESTPAMETPMKSAPSTPSASPVPGLW